MDSLHTSDDDELTIHLSRGAAKLLFSCMRRHNIDVALDDEGTVIVPRPYAEGAEEVYEFLRRAALTED